MRPGATPITLAVEASIRFATFDGVVIVLDLESEAYFAFDEPSSLFWNVLLAYAGDRVAAATHFGTRSHEFDSFVDECLRRNFLTAATSQVRVTTPLRRRRQARLTRTSGDWALSCHAWWHLVSTWATLRARGFRSIYLSSAPARSANTPARIPVERAVRAFVRAENLFWFRAEPKDCLPRSLALFRFLSALGIPAVHIIGGARFPAMLLHAWVEFEERPLLNDRDLIDGFTVLARIPT